MMDVSRVVTWKVVMKPADEPNQHSQQLLRGATGLTVNDEPVPGFAEIVINLNGVTRASRKYHHSIAEEIVKTVLHEYIHTFEDRSDPFYIGKWWEDLCFGFEKALDMEPTLSAILFVPNGTFHGRPT